MNMRFEIELNNFLNNLTNDESKLSKDMKLSKKPIVIIGESALEMKSGQFIFEEIKEYLKKNNFISYKSKH